MNSMRRIIFIGIIAAVIQIVYVFSPMHGDCYTDLLSDYKASFVMSFDKAVSNDIPMINKVINHGGVIISDGINGSALKLGKNSYLELSVNDIINNQEGSISLWVRPHWNYSPSESHTFISARWDNGGYFILSDGWWETSTNSGPVNTFLIYDNKDSVSVSLPNYYNENKWIHFVVSWKKNEEVKLYINGALARKSIKQLINIRSIKGNIIIGGDVNSHLSDNRWADCDIDEFLILNRALTGDQVLQLYKKFKPYKPVIDGENLKQIRLIADENKDWLTVTGAEKVINDIASAGFNLYMPCVWHGSGTRYPSQLSVADWVNFDQGDPLERIIELAHQKGIEVHPWFVISARNRDFFSEYYDGSPEGAFNVHRPEFREFITNFILEVVQKYDVDGINLDYIRSMGVCTSSYGVEDYKNKFNRDLLVDKDIYLSIDLHLLLEKKIRKKYLQVYPTVPSSGAFLY